MCGGVMIALVASAWAAGCSERTSAQTLEADAATTAPTMAPATRPTDTTSSNKDAVMNVTVRTIQPDGSLSEPRDVSKWALTDEQWRERLTPAQFSILRSSATERPFCGPLLNNKEKGLYACAGCGLPLFWSHAKFESGTGWPSFYQPAVKENVAERADRSHGMVRTEINCARCDGHLGHVFEDGPAPTGLRYCLNSESLRFVKDEDLKAEGAREAAHGAAR
jgi:methionine-R-sulfoxide reductase